MSARVSDAEIDAVLAWARAGYDAALSREQAERDAERLAYEARAAESERRKREEIAGRTARRRKRDAAERAMRDGVGCESNAALAARKIDECAAMALAGGVL